ncbi:MAG: hypothetical protein ACI8ZN_000779 [Bacteroidia bacterium]
MLKDTDVAKIISQIQSDLKEVVERIQKLTIPLDYLKLGKNMTESEFKGSRRFMLDMYTVLLLKKNNNYKTAKRILMQVIESFEGHPSVKDSLVKLEKEIELESNKT